MKATILSALLFSRMFLTYVSAFQSSLFKTPRTTIYTEISKSKDFAVEDRRVIKSLAVTLLSFIFTMISKDHIILAAPSSVLHYGTYCGPGPDRSVNTEPVDGFDSICKDHDIEYSLCQPEILPFQASALNGKETGFPTFVNQLISIRGKLPPYITYKISSIYPLYTHCIHRADTKFVRKLQALKVNDVLQHREGMFIAERYIGGRGRGNICLLGFKYGQNSDCLMSSYFLFTSVAMDLFSSDLEADAQLLNF